MTTPAHYAGTVTPWDLEKCMKSSGNAFVDARRTDAIEYCFRVKDDLLADLKKARHCLDEAIAEMEKQQPEFEYYDDPEFPGIRHYLLDSEGRRVPRKTFHPPVTETRP